MARQANMQVINWDIARQKLKQREQAIFSDPPEWIDIHEVCRCYKTSDSTVRRRIKEGRFPKPSMHLGKGSRRWNRQELDRLMQGKQDNTL